MTGTPRVPGWVRWMMSRLLSERDVAATLGELRELHAHWTSSLGQPEADRRFRRQVRQYPFGLLLCALAELASDGPWSSPRSLRQSARSLVRTPGLTAAIVLTVGIGIGGCATIFAVVDVLFLKGLPYPEADRLVWIHSASPTNQWALSAVDVQALEAQQTSFESLGTYLRNASTLVTDEGAERLVYVEAAPGLFGALGVQLLAGREATPAEGEVGADATVVVTHDFAASYLGATEADGGSALGDTVRIGATSYQVIGVLPSWFGPLARDTDVFTTLRMEPPPRKGPFGYITVGRLRDEVSPDAALEELRAINARIFPLWIDSFQDESVTWGIKNLGEVLNRDAGRLLAILMGAVGGLLLVATANAANLLLARVSGRRQEMVLRQALGATRGQIAGHLMVESVLLSLGGVVVGLLVAGGGLRLLPAVASSYLPRLTELRLEGSVLLFACILSAACCLLFGVVPAVRGSRAGSRLDGSGAGRTATIGAREQRTQRLLVGGQLALVLPLLTGGALLLTSFARLQDTDPGFDVESLLSMRVSLAEQAFPDNETREQFWTMALDRIEALPGVEAAAVSLGRPPTGGFNNNFDLEDKPTPENQSQPTAQWIVAEKRYFDVLGIPLVAGRMFEPTDLDADADPVVIVDEAWARKYFPGESVVGRRFVDGGQLNVPLTTVVGVVGAVPYEGLGETDSGAVYTAEAHRLRSPFLMIRVRGDQAPVAALVREQLRQLDPTAPITDLASGEALLSDSLTRPRHLSLLLATFAAIALGLAVVGLYGVMANAVERRRGEIAIRLALGGSPRGVQRLMVRQGMLVAIVGVIFGAVLSVSVTGVLADLLHEVEPADPRTLATVVVLMLGVALVACLVPSRRAARAEPRTALSAQ